MNPLRSSPGRGIREPVMSSFMTQPRVEAQIYHAHGGPVSHNCLYSIYSSPEEAGRYLETFKSYEKKPADLLKEQVEKDYLSKVPGTFSHIHLWEAVLSLPYNASILNHAPDLQNIFEISPFRLVCPVGTSS